MSEYLNKEDLMKFIDDTAKGYEASLYRNKECGFKIKARISEHEMYAALHILRNIEANGAVAEPFIHTVNVDSLITTIESLQMDNSNLVQDTSDLMDQKNALIKSQKEEIEKWREFGKVTIQRYKDNEHPLTAVNAQAKLDWISYTPTLCEIERQAIHWQEGDSK